MTFEEYEKFLAEMDQLGNEKVLLLDFHSLGGHQGFDESVEAKLKEVNLTKYFFRLGMPFNTQCNFTKRYKVEKACTLVAVSVKDSNKHLKCMASNT